MLVLGPYPDTCLSPELLLNYCFFFFSILSAYFLLFDTKVGRKDLRNFSCCLIMRKLKH